MDAMWQEYGMEELEKGMQKLFPASRISVAELMGQLLQGDVLGAAGTLLQEVIQGMGASAAGRKNILIWLIVLGILSALLIHFVEVFDKHQIADLSFYFIYLLMGVILLQCFSGILGTARETVENIVLFVRLMVPTYLLAVGVASGPATVGAGYQLMLLLIYGTEKILLGVVLPLIYCYGLLTMINGIWVEEKLTLLTELLEKAVGWILKASLGVVTGISVFQSLITPVLDSVKTSAVEKALSALPGIGNAADGLLELAVLAAFGDRQDLRHLKSPLPQRFGGFGACQSALIDGLRHLQKPAGAVSGGVEAGDGGLHFFICHDAVVLHSGTDFPGQRRTARNAQSHKHTRQLHHIAAGQLDAGDFLLAEDGVDFFRPDSHLRRKLCRQRRTIQQEGDAGRHRQERLHLMQGVFAAADHGHIFAPIEKGIAGGAIADAVALETRQPRDAGRRPRSTCGEDNSVRWVISIEGFYSEFIGIGQTHGLGGHKFNAHSLGPLDALTLQFRTRYGGGEAVVVLDKLCTVKRTRPPSEDGGEVKEVA